MVRANHEKALALGTHLLDLAEAAQDKALLLEAHNALGLTFFFQGKFASSSEHLDNGSRDAVGLAQQLSHPYSLAYARGIAAAIHQFRSEEQLTRDSAEASSGVATEYGFPFWSGFQTILLGWASAKRGKGEEGVAQIRQGMETYLATGAELLRPYLLGLLTDALSETGSTEQGLAVIAEALLTVEKTGERFYEAELYRQKGELLLLLNGSESSDLTVRQSRRSEIEECFFKAVSVAEKQQAKWFELRAMKSLARIWRKQGRNEEARRMLAEIYGWFTEGFDTVDLQDAKALLGELRG